MVSERSIDIRNATYRQLLDLLQNRQKACGLIVGEAGSGKTHAIFRALHRIDTPYLYIKYDQFLQQESLPIKIMNRIPETESLKGKCSANEEFDWLMGQSEINYQCKQKLTNTLNSIGRDIALIIDDIQWATMADIASFLDYIPNPLPDNLKIILIARNDSTYKQVIDTVSTKLSEIDENFTVFQINTLNHNDALKFLEECAHSKGLDVDYEIKNKILSHTNNNPFYIRFALDIYNNQESYNQPILDQGSLFGFINESLHKDLRYILFVGAQLGFQFPLSILERYFSFAPKILKYGLTKLKSLGILTDSEPDGLLEFSHDRIYEACKTLFISKHLRNVNRKLYKIFDSDSKLSIKDKHVNRSLFLIRSGTEIEFSANTHNVFIEGLQQAIDTFMYESSLEIATYLEKMFYDRKGLSENILPVKLTVLMAKAFYQQGDIDKATSLLNKAEKMETNPADRSELLLMQADIHFSNSNLTKAQRYTKKMLAIFGHPKLNNPISLKAYIAVQMVPLLSQLNSEESIRNLEAPCTDKNIAQYNKCLIKSATYYYSSDPFHSGLSLMIILRNSFKYGSSGETGLALQLFSSVIIGGFFREYRKAFYLSEYALFLNTLFSSRYYYYRSIFTYDCFLSYFDRKIDTTIEAVDKSFSRCLSVGASDLASYSAHLIALCRVDYNASLQDTKFRLLSYSERLSRHNLRSTDAWNQVLFQFIDDTEQGVREALMQGAYFDIRNLPEIDDKSLHYGAYHFRGISHMLRKSWAQAKSDFRKAKEYRYSAIGTYLEYLTQFYLGICEARTAIDAKPGKKSLTIRVERYLRFLSHPCMSANNTLASKREILLGYIQYLSEDRKNALQSFKTAAEISESNGHILDRILALEASSLVDTDANIQIELQNSFKKWCGHAFLF